jgi:GNAT superfamily N-acetyltransferase
MKLSWELTEEPTRFDLDAVDAGLLGFNLEQGGIDEVRRLAAFARDDSNVTVGGVIGRTWGGCFEVEVLWVREDQRGRGVGAKLLAMAEEEAVRRGCTLAFLDTFSFQAPGFYERHGYEESHSYAGFPRGITKHYFSKELMTAG